MDFRRVGFGRHYLANPNSSEAYTNAGKIMARKGGVVSGCRPGPPGRDQRGAKAVEDQNLRLKRAV